MNNKELQAIRKVLMLDVKEAAEHIGGVSARSWQRWEAGRVSVPTDIGEKVVALAERRNSMIDDCDALFSESDADEMDVAYYLSFAEYKADHSAANVIDWRLSQSVAAYYFSDGLATLS